MVWNASQKFWSVCIQLSWHSRLWCFNTVLGSHSVNWLVLLTFYEVRWLTVGFKSLHVHWIIFISVGYSHMKGLCEYIFHRWGSYCRILLRQKWFSIGSQIRACKTMTYWCWKSWDLLVKKIRAMTEEDDSGTFYIRIFCDGGLASCMVVLFL